MVSRLTSFNVYTNNSNSIVGQFEKWDKDPLVFSNMGNL
jgi:hypothetical protein